MTLDELERLDREATPRPWSVDPISDVYVRTPCGMVRADDNPATGPLIAAGRNALPSLLRIARAAKALRIVGLRIASADELTELDLALAELEAVK